MKEHKLLHISAYFVWSLTLVKNELQGTIWYMMVWAPLPDRRYPNLFAMWFIWTMVPTNDVSLVPLPNSHDNVEMHCIVLVKQLTTSHIPCDHRECMVLEIFFFLHKGPLNKPETFQKTMLIRPLQHVLVVIKKNIGLRIKRSYASFIYVIFLDSWQSPFWQLSALNLIQTSWFLFSTQAFV